MSTPWNYSNPVKIHFGEGRLSGLRDLVAGRNYCLLTYDDNAVFDRLVDKVTADLGTPAVVVRDVEPNPSFNGLGTACQSFGRARVAPDVIVALGGGSVIDTAKVLAASGSDFSRVLNFLQGRTTAETLLELPIIAVPTTAGTGSEVTCWATVWDTEAKQKYSLADKRFYPEHAVLDPALTLGIPRNLTLSTGLDALSHALESIWNINANPISTSHAIFAASEIIEGLPLLIDDLENVNLRARMMNASLSAGLAFSNTKTALAHSLSYYLTLHHGTGHGIACSFSLPAIMRSVIGRQTDCDAALKRIFGSDLVAGAVALERFLQRLGVSTDANSYGVTREDWMRAIDDALRGDRGRNFIGSRDAFLAAAV